MGGFPIISAGLALGFAHAFEADHVAAVTTMAADPARPGRPTRLAPVWWAIGHAVALFVLGLLAIGLGSSVPLDLSHWAERLVGPVLVLLGVRTMRRSGVFHLHRHDHGSRQHEHYHLHFGAGHHHPAHATEPGRRDHSPLLVGALHGVAGTGGALILAASAGFAGAAQGVAFLLAFGAGTVAAMALYGGAFRAAGALLQRRQPLAQAAMLLCGVVSVGIGLYLAGSAMLA